MKLFNIVRFDIVVGIINRKSTWLVLFLFTTYANSITHFCNVSGNVGNWGDYLMLCFQGSLPFRSTLFNEPYYTYPIQWLIIMIGCAVQNLMYPFETLDSVGVQLIVRTEKKVRWWISKCIWSLLLTFEYFVACCIVLATFCLISGGTLTLQLNQDILLSSFHSAQGLLKMNTIEKATSLGFALALVLLTLITINLLQLTIGLCIHPAAGFFTSVSVFGISAICFSPLAIGNYAMVIRNVAFLEGGMNTLSGVIIELLIIVSCVLIGILYVRKWDILPKQH